MEISTAAPSDDHLSKRPHSPTWLVDEPVMINQKIYTYIYIYIYIYSSICADAN